MRAATKLLIPTAAAAMLAACGGSSDEGTTNAAPDSAPVEVETLPPDESVATPSDDLANGALQPSEGNVALAPPADGEPLVAIKGSEPHD